jgi:hypothetical protein
LIAGARPMATGKSLLASGHGKARQLKPFFLPACGVAVLYLRRCVVGLPDLDTVVHRGAENECTEVEIHIRITKMVANVGIMGIEDFVLLPLSISNSKSVNFCWSLRASVPRPG